MQLSEFFTTTWNLLPILSPAMDSPLRKLKRLTKNRNLYLTNRLCTPSLALLLLSSAIAEETNQTRAGTIRRYSTVHCIGIEWDLEGDANHNATCEIEYRRAGTWSWRKAMNLLRIDYHGYYGDGKADRRYNMLAGSVFFLRPGAKYHLRLKLNDPDGGSQTSKFTIKTWNLPALPKTGRTFYVTPGDGGGRGSKEAPFKGLAAADELAQPGDVFLMHQGDYGRFSPKKSGEPGKPIVWKPAGDGQVDIHHLNIYANHIWLEGFNITRTNEKAWAGVRDRINNAKGIILIRNRIAGFHYGILLGRYKADGWYIADNEIIGDKDRVTGKGYGREHSGGEGVELNHSSNHVVCYNTISKVADGISYPGRNCDMYGNDIFDVSDDGLEPDAGYANVRMWGNRIQETHKAGISFQPMLCSPWYFIRNQVIGKMFKMRTCDRFVMVNNTFIVEKSGCGFGWNLLKCISRNNIWYGAMHNDYIWIAHVRHAKDLETLSKYVNYPENDRGFLPGWMTDLDYDAFGKKPNPPGQFTGDVFGWYDINKKRQVNFRSVKDFTQFIGGGVEANGIDIEAETTFEKWEIPAELWRGDPKWEGRPLDLAPQMLTLKPNSTSVDAGDILPNIHDDWFTGNAPDLGCHERDIPPPHYGVRDANAMKEHTNYWVLKKERRRAGKN